MKKPDPPTAPTGTTPENDATSQDQDGSRFIYVACNPDSQQHCKKEIASRCPQLLPSFSRRGFLTYKLNGSLPDRFDLALTFARTAGWSLEQIKDENAKSTADRITQIANEYSAGHIHVWRRDWVHRDQSNHTEPTLVDPVQALTEQILVTQGKPVKGSPKINQVADADQKIIDVVWIDEGYWWVGWHIAGSKAQRWPGGIPAVREPKPMISRAYLKTCEGLLWSGVNISKGDVCAEIGSAPGGSCQRLLELDAKVIAIDPADLDPVLVKNKRLDHVKMRGQDVTHRSLSKVSWLLVDSNVTPENTLDTVEPLATSEQTRFRGLLLTLKFSNPDMVLKVPEYVARVKGWGFKFVKTRQLAYGRREVLLMALKQKSVRRFRS